MRVVDLSSYGRDQLLVSRKAELAARSEQDLAEIRAMEAEAQARTARRPVFARLLRRPDEQEREAREALAAAEREVAAAAAARAQKAVRVSQRDKGERGEQYLADALGRRLDDEWVLHRGFQSGRGEADGVLVGPDGLWVIEVKSHGVRLTADGDEWWIEYLDPKRAAQGRKPARDQGGQGRVWGRQATDAAVALQGSLEREGLRVRPHTAVVLTDRRAEVALWRNTGLSLVTARVGELVRAVDRLATPLTPAERRRIEEILPRHHQEVETKRARRRT